MERISIKTGETQISRPAFWSDVEVNLEDTDRDELYEKMANRIKETKTIIIIIIIVAFLSRLRS